MLALGRAPLSSSANHSFHSRPVAPRTASGDMRGSYLGASSSSAGSSCARAAE